jgi:hypothetical protein
MNCSQAQVISEANEAVGKLVKLTSKQNGAA